MEIGSIYEISPNQPKEVRDELRLPFVAQYQKENTIYTASGREAIDLAILSLEKQKANLTKKVLMPSYICDSVFLPFIRRGWELVFYHIDRKMKASSEELKTLIQKEQPSMLFIHNYYGYDCFKEMEGFLGEIQKTGIFLMEDMTQSYYRKNRKNIQPDFILGSLRKWYAIPDGGFICSNISLLTDYFEDNSYFVKERMQTLTAKWEYLKELKHGLTENLLKQKERYLQRNRELEVFLDGKKSISLISKESLCILHETKEEDFCRRRNENYKILFRGFQKINEKLLVFRDFDQEAAALYFPVYIEKREEYQNFLQKNDVFAPVLWPIGEKNRPFLKDEDFYIFEHLLALPMDQRYGKEEMEKILNLTVEYLGK